MAHCLGLKRNLSDYLIEDEEGEYVPDLERLKREFDDKIILTQIVSKKGTKECQATYTGPIRPPEGTFGYKLDGWVDCNYGITETKIGPKLYQVRINTD